VTHLRHFGPAVTVLVLLAVPAHAQTADRPDTTDASRPFEIEDNSFFVEEAFNQEAGVVQTIVGSAFLLESGWAATVTQEWPVPGVHHQLSFTVPFGRVNGETGPGDVSLNYRYQLLEEGAGRPAIAPRLTLLMPTGSTARGLGAGAWGIQVNLPASKQQKFLAVAIALFRSDTPEGLSTDELMLDAGIRPEECFRIVHQLAKLGILVNDLGLTVRLMSRVRGASSLRLEFLCVRYHQLC